MKQLKELYENEAGYIDLLKDTKTHGVLTPDRTGIGCYKGFDTKLVWDRFPSSTIRPMGLKYAWEEMKLFLSGNPDTKILEKKGIMFWAGNTSREFLDSRGMFNYPEGSLGKSYSCQWRKAGGSVDQLKNLAEGLVKDPYSRRHAIDLWGVSEQEEFPLLPCWYRWSFFVEKVGDENILHLKTHSRSCDLLFGMTQHSTQAYMFLMALASMVGMRVGNLIHDFIDVHIYKNQLEYVSELVTRDCGEHGTVILEADLQNLEQLVSLPVQAFIREGYFPNRSEFKTPKPDMAV